MRCRGRAARDAAEETNCWSWQRRLRKREQERIVCLSREKSAVETAVERRRAEEREAPLVWPADERREADRVCCC